MFRKIQLVHQADTGSEGNPVTPPVTNGGESKQPEPEAKFTQADIDRIVAERLHRANQQAAEKEAKARADAEAKSLEEQKKFEELAAKRKLDLDTATAQLEQASQQGKRYAEALTKLLEQQRKGIPDHVIALLDTQDPVDQLEWLALNADKLKAPVGVPVTPKPNGGGASAEERAAAERLAARQLQSVF